MENVGIIAEYNPFHKGHLHQLETVRREGAETVTVCMSGNFVQRGSPAVTDKYERAKVAVLSGADLVIELPLRFSVASARDFAEGAVRLLSKAGFVDTLCFGSEHPDLSLFENSVYFERKAEKEGLIKKYSDTGISYASAREKAVFAAGGNFVPREPNDILAFEYVSAINRLYSDIKAHPIKRIGNYHDEIGEFSATAAREKIEKKVLTENDLPQASYLSVSEALRMGNSVSYEKFETVLLSYLRRCAAFGLEKTDVYSASGGLENRILKYAPSAVSLSELYEKVKTKRYAMSAVRRCAVSMFFGLEKNPEPPDFFHVLAFNEKGRELLKKLKKADLPVYHAFPSENDAAFTSTMQTEVFADNIYSLCKEKTEKGGQSFYNTGFNLK